MPPCQGRSALWFRHVGQICHAMPCYKRKLFCLLWTIFFSNPCSMFWSSCARWWKHMRLCVAYIPRGWLGDMDLMVAYPRRPIDYSRAGASFLADGVSIVLPFEFAPGVAQPCLSWSSVRVSFAGARKTLELSSTKDVSPQQQNVNVFDARYEAILFLHWLPS